VRGPEEPLAKGNRRYFTSTTALFGPTAVGGPTGGEQSVRQTMIASCRLPTGDCVVFDNPDLGANELRFPRGGGTPDGTTPSLNPFDSGRAGEEGREVSVGRNPQGEISPPRRSWSRRTDGGW